MSEAWSLRQRPERLEARFEFSDYEGTRVFLEAAAAVSKEEDLYPDISFGRTYVNLTLHAEDDEEGVGSAQQRFARRIEKLAAGPGA